MKTTESMDLAPKAALPDARREAPRKQSDDHDRPLSNEEARNVALGSPWLAEKDNRVRALLSSKMEFMTLKKGASLSESDRSSLFCAVSGLAVMTYRHAHAGTVVHAVIRPQRWFGEHVALGRRPATMSVVARQRCQFAFIRQEAIRDLLSLEPGLGWTFFNLNALNVGEHIVNAVDLLMVEPRLRVCSRLLTFAGRTLNHIPVSPLVVPLKQDEIARAANVSRSTAFHVIGELAEKGICEVGYRQVTILDAQRLADLIDNHEG